MRSSGVLAVMVVGMLAGVNPPVTHAEPPKKLTLAMYAPSAPFTDSSARAAYVRAVAKTIETHTGIPTTAESFADYSVLVASKPDLAILDAPCVVMRGATVLATATIGGDGDQGWALFARDATTLAGVAGKRLSFLKTGCRDTEFLDNAMLASELVASAYFGKLIGKNNLLGTVAAVRDYRDADAVFAPVGRGAGLKKIFDTRKVPNPGLVVMKAGLDAAVIATIKDAVLRHDTGEIIEGWRAAVSYAAFADHLKSRRRPLLLATPERLRMVHRGVLSSADATIRKAPVRRALWQPPVTAVKAGRADALPPK